MNILKVLLTSFLMGSTFTTIQSNALIVPLHLHYPNTQFQRLDCLRLYMAVSNTHRTIPNYITSRKATPTSVQPHNSAHCTCSVMSSVTEFSYSKFAISRKYDNILTVNPGGPIGPGFPSDPTSPGYPLSPGGPREPC
jgi:hypothetical protein